MRREVGSETMKPRRRKGLKIAGIIAGGLVAVVLLATAILLYRLSRVTLPSDPQPAATYEEAVGRIAELKARDGDDIIRPTIFLDQGSRVETAVVLFHGFTNNPEQFERIGRDYYAAGYNVLIPRLPEHGQRDLMTRDLSKITSARLADAMNEAVDIAAGLGENVEVVGLSGGGTLAALAARDREEVSKAVIISPLFGVDFLPNSVVRLAVAWSHVLPDVYMWWDPGLKEKHLPSDAYPRYSLKSVGAFFEVAFDVTRGNPKRRGELDRVVLITNAADRTIDEAQARRAVSQAIEPLAADYEAFEFPRPAGHAHDLIDSSGLNAENIDAIYGKVYPYLGLPPREH